MTPLSPNIEQKILALAIKHQISVDAVMILWHALIKSNGMMAQFNHPELGGYGQWMPGMTMVSDMFNDQLKAKVDSLCTQLASLLANEPLMSATSQPAWRKPPSINASNWWAAALGTPQSAGGQNNIRYAYFADKRRLAVQIKGRVMIYDTLEHRISGISQQQGSTDSLLFTSQLGVVDVAKLPRVG